MTLTQLTWIVTIILCLVFLIISIRTKDSASTSFLHYAIAGGTLPFFMILFTDISSIMGVGNFIGHGAKGYEIGYANIPFVVGEQGSKIIFALLFAGFAGRFTYITIAELMDDLLFRDKVSRAIIGILTASIMISWIAGQGKGLGEIFAAFTGADPLPIILFFSAIFIIYTCLGGIYSVVWTDLIQGVLVVILGVAFYYMAFAPVNWSLTELKLQLTSVGAGELASMNLSFGEVITKFITGCFGILAAQMYWQRCFAARDGKTATRGMLYSGIIVIVFTILTTLVGMVAKALNPNLEANHAMAWMIMEQMPLFATVLIFTLILVAAMSSADSLLHSAAVIVVNDLIRPFAPNKTDQDLVKLTRWCVLIVGIFAVVTAIWADSIIGLFSLAYTMAGGGVVPVLLVGLLWKRLRATPFTMGMQNSKLSPWGARVGLITGSIFSLWLGILYGITISFLLTIIVSLLTPLSHQKTEDNKMDHTV
ncbi:sodium:solute symporter family protein [Ammoniphilus resinae]|uniref:Na+/proline symporter n=1 Tax=Ammoniphilus resinae TaxID=861532 RepID=A0ABS4GPD5_9BACL|nr:sodium:solute symporter family protein [Ammoniphilus resinae]MBP1931720.1 Na+/proline symporter [Ammoniphilus resinae]